MTFNNGFLEYQHNASFTTADAFTYTVDLQ